jgi:hypothetical protein
MSQNQKWTNDDYEEISWHDNVIHAIRICNPSEGYDFDLSLDIDFILEWIHMPDNSIKFSVAPATLTFRNVQNLIIDVDLSYKESMEIDGIERELIESETREEIGYIVYKWVIRIQSFAGRENKIQFKSDGFEQVLTKKPVIQDGQRLE